MRSTTTKSVGLSSLIYSTSQGLAPKELLAVHPLGKSPVITYEGVTIAESGAIIGLYTFPLALILFL